MPGDNQKYQKYQYQEYMLGDNQKTRCLIRAQLKASKGVIFHLKDGQCLFVSGQENWLIWSEINREN